MNADPLSARLALLLPAMTEAMREPVAQALAAEIRMLAQESWTGLVQHCVSSLPEPRAAALRTVSFLAAETDLLLTSVARAVTPPMLLAVPAVNSATIQAELLAHPRASLREQTLDALADPCAGASALRAASATWSRRMLISELGSLPALTHTERLALQDDLLDDCPNAMEPAPQSLAEALGAGANDRAMALLAERAGVSRGTAEVAIALRDRRMLLSLCWKAECDASETILVLIQLARIPPDRALAPPAGGTGRELDADRKWRLEVLQEISGIADYPNTLP